MGFQHWHPTPVTAYGNRLAGQSELGGVWEWTSTSLRKFEGFEPLSLYPGYTGRSLQLTVAFLSPLIFSFLSRFCVLSQMTCALLELSTGGFERRGRILKADTGARIADNQRSRLLRREAQYCPRRIMGHPPSYCRPQVLVSSSTIHHRYHLNRPTLDMPPVESPFTNERILKRQLVPEKLPLRLDRGPSCPGYLIEEKNLEVMRGYWNWKSSIRSFERCAKVC